ncbi:MAG: hypothetical protein CL480_11370 [Acidobacteria bacterium]|nr:hypothetical protein [Acidobacteriota bacterium]|tara:strand:- start:5865 stop:6200 length:336 start_codon:yes stop_codon:yes gene_type:complete
MVLHAIHGCDKKKARSTADAVSTYGLDIIPRGELTHELRVGLILNQSRTDKRRSASIVEAIGTAIGGSIDKSFFEATSNTQEEADAAYEYFTAKKKQADGMSQVGKGGGDF